MKGKAYIVILALLGDPEVLVGIPGTGGFNKTVNELLKILKKSDKNIIVITNKSKYNSNNSTVVSNNICIYRIEFESYWESNQNSLVDNIDEIIERVKSIILSIVRKAEICLIHSFYWISGLVASRIKEMLAIPFIHTVVSLSEDKVATGVKPHAVLQRELEARFLPKADIIFAITPQEKKTLIIKYNIDESMIRVVGRSINNCFEEAYHNNKVVQSFYETESEVSLSEECSWWTSAAFLYVGRIVEIKGIKQIIAAWITAKEKYNISIPLWFVGGTPQQIQKIRKMIITDYPCLINFERNRQLIWWGNLHSSDISTLMRKAQALIMHSRFEAGGRVIVEAFSAGIPVIATPYGFAHDYIHNGYNGFITEFNSIEKLAKIMKRFNDQPYLSAVMGEAAHKFMNTIQEKWSYENNHFTIYDAYLRKTKIPAVIENSILPYDINSFKSRNCVTVFPYFSTEISNNALSEIINNEIGEHSIFCAKNDSYHSDIYYINSNRNIYYLKHFYHILTNRLSKLQYKNQNVISAQEQAFKSINSTSLINIAKIKFGDTSKLLYIIPYYNEAPEDTSFDVLYSLWKEILPDKYYIELYLKKDFKELKRLIDTSDNLMLNNLFCAEIAYKELFSTHNLPEIVAQKISEIMKDNNAVSFGLNYGKGILEHIVLEGSTIKLLPAHSMYIGELGFDVVSTFLQYNKDDVSLWLEIKNTQSVVASIRLDLWFLIIVYALEKEDEYDKIIRFILNL